MGTKERSEIQLRRSETSLSYGQKTSPPIPTWREILVRDSRPWVYQRRRARRRRSSRRRSCTKSRPRPSPPFTGNFTSNSQVNLRHRAASPVSPWRDSMTPEVAVDLLGRPLDVERRTEDKSIDGPHGDLELMRACPPTSPCRYCTYDMTYIRRRSTHYRQLRVIDKKRWGEGRIEPERSAPMAFTERGKGRISADASADCGRCCRSGNCSAGGFILKRGALTAKDTWKL